MTPHPGRFGLWEDSLSEPSRSVPQLDPELESPCSSRRWSCYGYSWRYEKMPHFFLGVYPPGRSWPPSLISSNAEDREYHEINRSHVAEDLHELLLTMYCVTLAPAVDEIKHSFGAIARVGLALGWELLTLHRPRAIYPWGGNPLIRPPWGSL